MYKAARDVCYNFRLYIPAPEMIERAPGLRLGIDRPGRFERWVFRGPLTLPVAWNAR